MLFHKHFWAILRMLMLLRMLFWMVLSLSILMLRIFRGLTLCC